MAQCAQLQPQDDLPFFLSFTSFAIIAATIIRSPSEIRTVDILLAIQLSIKSDSFQELVYFTLTLVVSLVASL